MSKPQESNGDEQQTIDSMMQKLKAQGQKVQMVADIGDSILIEVTSQCQQHSCMKKSPPHKNKHMRLRFNFQECEEWHSEPASARPHQMTSLTSDSSTD